MISDLQSATFVLGLANLIALGILLFREPKESVIQSPVVFVEKEKSEAKLTVAIGGIEKTITEYPYGWDFKITKPGIYKITINTKEDAK